MRRSLQWDRQVHIRSTEKASADASTRLDNDTQNENDNINDSCTFPSAIGHDTR